ncbi:MAG: hypothetical protein RL417_2284 [Pseudomonadota bacterium]|jgi:GH15 family glucan-1,4-alpha-glucosidase
MYNYGVIGNCSLVALIDNHGGIDWLCLPSPDSPPLFGQLLDPEGGRFSISAPERAITRQRYLEHTNILTTDVETAAGVFRITDFCPRYEERGRTFRPREICRKVEPLSGAPYITVACRAIAGWERTGLKPYVGSHAIHYEFGGTEATLSTTIAPGDIVAERIRPLTEPVYFVLGHGSEPIGDLRSYVEDGLKETEQHWRTWVGHLALPARYQPEVVRSALTLKLNCLEESGAILAAPTTSLPEEFGGERNWDYRFCWLRDSAFVLDAFRKLGRYEEMAEFLSFLLEVAGSAAELHPVYRANRTLPLPEEIHLGWRGFRDSRPVRSNNQAAEHRQYDVYGEMLHAVSPLFLDERMADLRSAEHTDLFRFLAEKAAATIGERDAGPWEFRSHEQVHAFSALASWVGLRDVAAAQAHGHLKDIPLDIPYEMTRAAKVIEAAVVDGAVRNGPADPSFDAALLLMPIFGYPDRGLNERTVSAIHRALAARPEELRSPHLYRYRRADDFGTPRGSFVICSYWLTEALARLGHLDEARRMMEELARCTNHLGLLSEHIDPVTYEQSGNFPQAYSHVGLINAAFAISGAAAPTGERRTTG